MNVLGITVGVLMIADTSSAPAQFAVPPGRRVFVPPDIKYWAYGELNTTVYDNLGLPWFCYTNRQTHCLPLFPLPPGFRTTRRPFVRQGGDDEWDEEEQNQVDGEHDVSHH